MSKTWHDVAIAAKKHAEKYDSKINPTEANILVDRIMSQHKTVEECYAVRRDALAFLKSNASQEDKQRVWGHLESLGMIISAIEEGILELPTKG